PVKLKGTLNGQPYAFDAIPSPLHAGNFIVDGLGDLRIIAIRHDCNQWEVVAVFAVFAVAVVALAAIATDTPFIARGSKSPDGSVNVEAGFNRSAQGGNNTPR